MDYKKKKIIAWSLMVFWMAFIFFMSNQPGDVSSKQSDFVVVLLDMLGIDLNSRFGDLSTLIIRKGAHFTEYMILYFLAFNLLRLYISKKKAYICSLFIVFGYACTDEFHQLFIEGRSGQFKDVLIDTSGGAFGMVLIYLKNKFCTKKA
ncbi:VanZ family protein [Clostridium sp. LIBA-8841]|uniref:VanZ family protein n=1 Tax=Clostridium sp. LIBA-8841 TaxID=2987530 RepID=UPI002AC4B187|nr:VanZ family protein [Clostridium sp. LIBA-8841]MDZ5255369.1 VanZ family protein [Clostridium sp. LIBA-8841]